MIKSDRWIIRMGQEKRMIEPFEAKQVKMLDGKPVISYGVSSYGYDIRVGRKFKILNLKSSLLVGEDARSAGGGGCRCSAPPIPAFPHKGGRCHDRP